MYNVGDVVHHVDGRRAKVVNVNCMLVWTTTYDVEEIPGGGANTCWGEHLLVARAAPPPSPAPIQFYASPKWTAAYGGGDVPDLTPPTQRAPDGPPLACEVCSEHFPFAVPNTPEGLLVCWSCDSQKKYHSRSGT